MSTIHREYLIAECRKAILSMDRDALGGQAVTITRALTQFIRSVERNKASVETMCRLAADLGYRRKLERDPGWTGYLTQIVERHSNYVVVPYRPYPGCPVDGRLVAVMPCRRTCAISKRTPENYIPPASHYFTYTITRSQCPYSKVYFPCCRNGKHRSTRDTEIGMFLAGSLNIGIASLGYRNCERCGTAAKIAKGPPCAACAAGAPPEDHVVRRVTRQVCKEMKAALAENNMRRISALRDVLSGVLGGGG